MACASSPEPRPDASAPTPPAAALPDSLAAERQRNASASAAADTLGLAPPAAAALAGAAAPASAVSPPAAARAAPSSPRRAPLLPWPFFGRRSLAALGASGVAALPPGSPEHRLLVQLDLRECAPRGETSGGRCHFLERGSVYEIRRQGAGEPARFVLRRLAVDRETPAAAAALRVDLSDPEQPFLILPRRAADSPGPEEPTTGSAP
ncbi:MAG: hypothetical protein ABR599_11190 [Gemmatimonadota bacterium]